MKPVLQILAVAFLVSLSATAARAQVYIGGSLGSTAMEPTVAEDAISQWNTAAYGAGWDCDTLSCYSQEDTSVAMKFFGGYRVNSYFAVEGFLTYLGEFESYAEDGYGVYAWATADVSTLGAAVVGMIPVSDRVSLIGKLGVHSWEAEGDIVLEDIYYPVYIVGSYEESGTDIMGGLGVEINFGAHMAMRVEFEYFEAKTDYTDFGIGFLSVGAMYRF